ncbi:GNAT family N-acetyltransferase [Bacillus horti]|uniref:Ribosomal protein S18 acetylase RimI-like enzyme n=1 Tax=Caldalkalibacillus horti TaxID=77523 RepID=A0ABT9VW83_9BACI|nr:GNAT family N-acetyltransferase [Bacillus horti]MDQ0165262.1 ribosomal protein S18 acetylase RimI-like enzyme [Bacillus horti]
MSKQTSEGVTLEKLEKGDAEQLVELAALVQWDYTLEDVHTILSSGTVFGHKTEQGKLLSSAALFPYGGGKHSFASLGMVIVHPDARGMGLGRKVTEACVAMAQGEPVVLVATKQGVPLYEKLGFKKVATLQKLLAESVGSPSAPILANMELPSIYQCRAYEEADFERVVEIDSAAFGATRETFLRVRIKQSRKAIVLINEQQDVVGFGLGIAVSQLLLIGPLVAPSDSTAELVMREIVKGHAGQVRIDVPEGHSSFITLLSSYGFQIANQPPVMLCHANELPKRNGCLYGIASQAFG